jgi:hypothetical protein
VTSRRQPRCSGACSSERQEEVDCDFFLECLAPLLDGRIDDPELREKIAHHVRQCAECNEELEIVKKSLEP